MTTPDTEHPTVRDQMADTPASLIAKIASVANIIGWQAGEAGCDIAGGIVSFLAAHPEHLDRFLREPGEMMIDGTVNPHAGALTWRTADGRIMDRNKYAAAPRKEGSGK